ncbi:MAG: type II toxin-antitoxin system RelE/ParE family toxin [Bacillota bacterium]
MWKVEYLREALEDIRRLDPSQRIQVLKAVNKVAVNPLPLMEGGYGKPLASRSSMNLTGYCKIKIRKLGLRVVYKVSREDATMKVVVVSRRANDEVYLLAHERRDS